MEAASDILRQIPEIQLSFKLPFVPFPLPKVTTPETAYEILLSNWNPNLIELLEQFKIMLLNRASRVLGIYEVSSGGMAGTIVDPKLIFAAAIKSAASAIILAHNHPSGDLTPSEEDIELTKKIKAGGEILEIEVLDHLIVSREGFVSIKEVSGF